MDVFLEQIIARKHTGVDLLKKIGVCLGVLLVAAIMVLCSTMSNVVGELALEFGIFIVIGAGYGAYRLITALNVEYEYILTNGELDVDKIVARRARKRLITANCRTFTEFGEYTPDKQFPEATLIMACIHPQAPDTYYAVVENLKYGHCVIVFNPSEKILTNMKTYIKRNVIK